MRQRFKLQLSIPHRLLLLTIIPVLGLIAAGALSLRTLYSEYRGFTRDAQGLAAFRQEVNEFIGFAGDLAQERNAALAFMAHRTDPKLRAAYTANFAKTDADVTTLFAKLDHLSASPDGALFADKAQAIRTAFTSQLPDARQGALQGKRTSGDVFQLYMKLTYTALFVSECYRGTLQTPAGLNIFDAILALQKIQQQESVATDLMWHGLRNGGLQKDEVPLLRRQFIVSTENEYYLLKFQPDLRAYFKAQTRSTPDDTAFYTYLGDLAGTLRDGAPLPVFKPKAGNLATLVANHFQAYARVYDYGFDRGITELRGIAAERRRHAMILGLALGAVLALSLGMNLALRRGTRRDLADVASRIELASADVKAASLQLAAAGNRMSQDASEFAAGIDQISGSVAEVASVAEANRQHAAKATTTTTHAREAVDAGLSTITELEKSMGSARTSAHKINQVIARINDISFQTNLLALNAAVEAARAGSAGAGFAVVADEVRQLAGRCAEAARESAQLIGDAAQDTADAIAKSDELATRFKNVSTGIHEVSETVTQITTSFLQQADSIGQINQAVSNQRGIAQSVAAAAQQTASTAISMETQVESLETSVVHMDTLLGDERPQHRETAAAATSAAIAGFSDGARARGEHAVHAVS
ncbi:MAG TPA: methyl-accepting chemotaxis protein [Opitutaceae bacterium]|nr:methyl-accepting chemotaxis protein [Opitutaceae bacterium]